MTTYAQRTEALVTTSHEIARRARKIGHLADTLSLAMTLSDTPRRDDIASITLGLSDMSLMGGSAELLTVTGTDGIEYRDFDELYDLVQERVFDNGPGVPASLLATRKETFDVQALIAKIPTLTGKLDDEVDAFRTFMADA